MLLTSIILLRDQSLGVYMCVKLRFYSPIFALAGTARI